MSFRRQHPVRAAVGDLTGNHVIRMRLAPLSPEACEQLTKETGRTHPTCIESPAGIPSSCARCSRVPATACRNRCATRSSRGFSAARLRRAKLAEFVSMSPGRTEAWLIKAVLGPPRGPRRSAAHVACWNCRATCGFRHELARLAVYEHDARRGGLCGMARADAECARRARRRRRPARASRRPRGRRGARSSLCATRGQRCGTGRGASRGRCALERGACASATFWPEPSSGAYWNVRPRNAASPIRRVEPSPPPLAASHAGGRSADVDCAESRVLSISCCVGMPDGG